jgi:hypothetical protein
MQPAEEMGTLLPRAHRSSLFFGRFYAPILMALRGVHGITSRPSPTEKLDRSAGRPARGPNERPNTANHYSDTASICCRTMRYGMLPSRIYERPSDFRCAAG